MAFELDDANALDPFGEDEGGQSNPEDQQGNENNPTSGPDNGGGAEDNGDDGDVSVINALLASKGIADSSKIKFDDDDGKTIERAWKDLTKEEKINILKTESSAAVTDILSQEELNFINQIRDSLQSPGEYLRSLREQAMAAQQQQPVYEIDDISDDELFVLDALDRYGEENITDEQLDALLTNAKSDPELYTKTIATLRTQYRTREDDLKFQMQQNAEAQREEEFGAFSESILQEIQSLNNIAGQDIELTLDDKNELANYILTRDENGNSEFGMAMNDPKLFTQMAFWALKGNDIMNEISSQIKGAYEKGVEAGKKGQSQLVIDTRKKDTKGQQVSADNALALDVS